MGRATPRDPDVDDLMRSLNQVEAEFRGGLDALLVSRLVAVLNRRSPLRWVGAAPVRHAARLGFANGLTVLAHAPNGKAFLRILVPMHRGQSVLLEKVARVDDGVQITLAWGASHRVTALVTGFDQLD